MRNYLLAGVSLVAIGIGGAANAADTLPPVGKTFCDPYKNYACIDSYLGQDFMTRFINYYRLEWGHEAAPSDPKAAPSRRDLLACDTGEPFRRIRSPNGPTAVRPQLASRVRIRSTAR